MISKNSVAYHIECDDKKIFLKEILFFYNSILYSIFYSNVYAMICYGCWK